MLFCAAGPLSLTAAPAVSAHAKATTPSTAASGEATAAPQTKRAERAARAEGAAGSPTPGSAPAEEHPESAAAGRKRRAQPLARGGRSRAVESPGVSAGPGPRGSDHGSTPIHGRRRVAAGRHAAVTGTLGEEGPQPVAESGQQSEALAKRQKKGGGGGHKGKGGKGKEKGGKGKGKEKEREVPSPTPGQGNHGTGVQPAREAGEPTALAASVTTGAGASGASSTSTAFSPAAPAGAPAVGLDAHRSVRPARHRQPKAPAGSPRTAVAAAPAAQLVPAAAVSRPSTIATHAAKKAREPAGQPALVKTFTKIVGVVPTPIRILIAALVALALALAARSRLVARRTRRLVRQRGQLLEDVGLLQAALLPVPPPRLGPVGTTAAYRPADGPGAGGDFYDVFALEDGQLAVIVGDVSGHGREALPHTALLRFTVRAYLEAGLSPRKALQTAGTVLERQLGDSFATVVAATYHPRERTLTYASAGHPPPIVLAQPAEPGDAGAVAPVTAGSSPPIGTGARTGTRQTVVSVPGPAQLCFHTDGVTEARLSGELFGAGRLAGTLAALGRDASAATLLDSVAGQTDARPDDMAACLLRVEDGAGAPSILLEQMELDREAAASPRTERFLRACGVGPAEAAEILESARAAVERGDAVLLELRFEGGAPVVSLRHDNVIHTAALAAAGASLVSR